MAILQTLYETQVEITKIRQVNDIDGNFSPFDDFHIRFKKGNNDILAKDFYDTLVSPITTDVGVLQEFCIGIDLSLKKDADNFVFDFFSTEFKTSNLTVECRKSKFRKGYYDLIFWIDQEAETKEADTSVLNRDSVGIRLLSHKLEIVAFIDELLGEWEKRVVEIETF